MKHHSSKSLTTSSENYMEAVLMVQEKKGVARSVDLAQKLGVSKPSVSVAVHALEEAGYLSIDEDKTLHLTEAGMEIAQSVYEKHRFFTKMLTHLGVDPATAEDDACRIEHDISEETFSALKRFSGRCALSVDEAVVMDWE